MSEPYKFAYNLSQRLDIRSWNKHVVLQNFSIYSIYLFYFLKAVTWNDKFE